MVEVLVAAATISVLAGIAVPNYRRTVERAHLRAARDVLLTIYAGEHVYASLNDGDFVAIPENGDWSQIFMVNPNVDAATGATFEVDVFGGGTQFTVDGVLSGQGKLGELAMDEQGLICCDRGADCPAGTTPTDNMVACIFSN